MTPEQIDTVTNGLINLHTFVADWWPALVGLGIAAVGTWLAFRCARFLGTQDRVPAAPDNQPGTNTDDLWTCRRIGSEPLANPDQTRRLINYLRDTGEEQQP